jgi:histidinol-phosphate phosphatase family protein
MAKAVFLDRDHTLNPDSGYISDPNKFDLYPWVPEELKKLKLKGFLLIVVSNQSGIARGLITWEQLNLIHRKMDEILDQKVNIKIDSYQVCPHHPDEGCDCRKPKPKLLIAAAQAFQIDLSESFMVGDRDSDMNAGKKAGVKQALLVTPDDELSFRSAVQQILNS